MSTKSRTTTSILTAAGAALAITGVALMSPLASAQGSIHDAGNGDGIAGNSGGSTSPAEITLTGIVRDFRERNDASGNGHPDFERRPSSGFGHYMGNIEMELDDNFKPVFSGEGAKVNRQWKDSAGRPIHPSLYDPSLGDSAGAWGSDDSGGITSASSFAQWFRDTPGKNMSKPLDITLVRQANSNVYVFDDRQDPFYQNRGGFFPINNDLFLNSSGDNKNFHFTYELQTEFVYEANSGQIFTFNGDDDVWVFIDGRCVIDIGGVHGRTAQTVDLDRLDWLDDGGVYRLSFFFAERHRTQSNFRVETTLQLRAAALPTVAGMAD